MDDEMLTEKTRKGIASFLNLHGDSYREKKRSLNGFIKTLQAEYSYEEVQDFINNLITTTEYDHNLKNELIVHFQLESSIVDVLKTGNDAAVGRILKNWKYFKNLLNKMSVDDFVDNFLPKLSYKTSMKVIKIIGKNINDNPKLADDLFNRLEEKCGIKTAIILLHCCSLNLIKDKCSKYILHLSCRSLLEIYKKHPEFLEFYFELMIKTKHKNVTISNYTKIFKYIARTRSNIPFFWRLNKNYQFFYYIGSRGAMKLLPTKERMIKHSFFNPQTLITGKHLLNAARKVDMHKELILKSYPNNISDYIRDISPNNSPIIYMPRKQIFPLLQELFMKMYKENFDDYVYLINGDFLQYFTTEEREYVLDKISDKEDFLHYYPINRSIPIVKEKLKSANDPDTRLDLIRTLYKTCNINNDVKALLEVLKFVYGRYKNDTRALHEFVNDVTYSWKDYSRFSEEHWETIYNLIEYLEYSGIHTNWEHFFERHFVWLVDNDKPYKDLLDEFMKRCLKQFFINKNYSFGHSKKHMKIFIKEMSKRLEGESQILHFGLLDMVVEFDKRFPKEINVLEYAYILDYGVNYSSSQQTGHEFYFIKNYNKDKSFNKYIQYFNQPHNINTQIILYCLEYCPEELHHFQSIHKKIHGLNKIIRKILLCPYFIKSHLRVYTDLCFHQLEDSDVDIEAALLKFISYDKKFIDVVSKFLPPEDAKIEPNADKIFVTKQQQIIKYIPQISTPENMKLIRIFCKADYLKYALGSLYKIAYKVPQNLLPEFLQNIYEAAVSVKKHALYLGRHLLPVNSYHDFLVTSSRLETNLSMRNILLKKTLEYFIENVDEKFFNLFIDNLQKIDKNDKDLYDHLIDYSKMPQEFLARYITIIYDNIMSNEDQNIRDKAIHLIENLPNYVIDEINVDLMMRYLKTADLATTNFINKCLFHTTGEKHNEIYAYIMKLITELVKKCTPTNIQMRSKVTTLIITITNEARSLNNIKIIENLHTILKTNVQQHTLITIKLLLEHSIIFLKSNKDPKIFSENIKPHLFEMIELYSFNMIEFYTKELQSFIDSHDGFDKFLFIENLFNDGNENEIVYFVVIGLFPWCLPTEKNCFANYVPMLEKLKLSDDPRIMADLDLYFQRAS
nr:uncharacterized protein LOC111415784 [Onthophagus taurus]